jgi:hypothetical protein
VNVNDLTPMYVGLGDNPSDNAKGGPNAKFVPFSGEPGSNSFGTGKDLDKHVLPGFDKYHGMNDQMYLKMYEQQKKQDDPAACRCGKK